MAAAAIAAATPVPTATQASVDEPYDGIWEISIPRTVLGTPESGASCPAVTIRIEIRGSKISGSLQQGGTGAIQTGSSNRTAAPVTGGVSSSGWLSAQWMGYKASGQLRGNNGRLTVQRTCGKVGASASRVSS
jgi:hypothetical protein